jgi:hypothetical protein
MMDGCGISQKMFPDEEEPQEVFVGLLNEKDPWA